MASEIEKGVDNVKRAVWDSKSHKIWIDICIEEVRAGNRTGTHLSREGWKSLVDKFKIATGKDYDRKQHKNHWDSTKKEWQVWDALVRQESGLGWDTNKQTISASDEWWEKKIQRYPEAAKFRVKGLEHSFQLDELFMDVTATGSRAWAPTSGTMPPLYGQSSEVENGNDSDVGGDANIEEDNLPDTPTLDNNTNGSTRGMGNTSKRFNQSKKTKKINASMKLSTQLDRICAAVESRSSRTDLPGCSIKEVLKMLVEIPECPKNSQLFMFGTRLFLKRENREMFIALEDPETQLLWLKQEYMEANK